MVLDRHTALRPKHEDDASQLEPEDTEAPVINTERLIGTAEYGRNLGVKLHILEYTPRWRGALRKLAREATKSPFPSP